MMPLGKRRNLVPDGCCKLFGMALDEAGIRSVIAKQEVEICSVRLREQRICFATVEATFDLFGFLKSSASPRKTMPLCKHSKKRSSAPRLYCKVQFTS